MVFWDKFVSNEGGFWKRYWKLITVVSLIYIFLTLGKGADSASGQFYILGVAIGAFGFISLFLYIYYKIKSRKKK